MSEPRKLFAEALIACEEPHPGQREQYEKELRAMLDNKLSAAQKRTRLISAVVCALLAAFMGHAGIEAFRARTPAFHLPAFIGTYMLLTAAALCAVMMILTVTWWQGVYRRDTHGKLLALIAVVYVGLTGWIFMLAARFAPELFRDDLTVFGLVLLLYAATAWIRQRVGQAELKTREKLLEIELRLAEIAENLGAKAGGK
jgi:hypothetical protein